MEKSFSDSDEEPLATKIVKQPVKPIPKKRGRKSNQELAAIAARKAEEDKMLNISKPKVSESPKLSEPKSSQVVVKKPPQATLTMPDVKRMDSPKNKMILTPQKPIKPTEPPVVKSSTVVIQTVQKKEMSIKNDDDEFVKGFDTPVTKPMASQKPSINLLPSKEESEKIFGIASVTLAQSCGPLDTKCTLGKCGSVHVHKPPLGPTVLTESALGASLSPKDRRKSKVNMTREQIQKWLEEASWTPIPDDESETVNLKITSKASTSSVGLSKSGDDSQSSSLIREKLIDHPSPSTSGKDALSKVKTIKSESPITAKFLAKVDEKIKSNFPLKSEEIKKQSPSILNNQTPVNLASSKNNVSEKKTPIYQQQQLQQQQLQQQRRTPVYKTESKPNPKLTPILPKSFGAFSPENEHSIYSFDREDDDLPTPTTPFRRSNSKADSEAFPKPSITPNKQSSQQSHVSLTLSPEDNKKSASISVEMTGDNKHDSGKADNKEKDAENDSDSEGHTFYIPLQASNASGSKTIQGVAVKLGTEGAEGPNQRIIMHAKLVTKSRTNTAPLPESMTNVQELVKTLMATKETQKPVPCATVQPRFKSNDGHNEGGLQPEPSTSSLVANQRSKQTPKLGKIFKCQLLTNC